MGSVVVGVAPVDRCYNKGSRGKFPETDIQTLRRHPKSFFENGKQAK